jgi:XTP/dITP diphosphohydrolase
MAQLLIITADPNDPEDLHALIGDDYNTVSLNEVDADDVAEVSGSTLSELAMEIASEGAKQTGLETVAEATCIVVDRLNGLSGMQSATCAGEDATDKENRDFLLRELRDAPANGRSARPVSAVSVAAPDGRLKTFESALERVVVDAARGVEGSGYEPIFELDDGMTIAELLADRRNDVRSRALAVSNARPFIEELLGTQG